MTPPSGSLPTYACAAALSTRGNIKNLSIGINSRDPPLVARAPAPAVIRDRLAGKRLLWRCAGVDGQRAAVAADPARDHREIGAPLRCTATCGDPGDTPRRRSVTTGHASSRTRNAVPSCHARRPCHDAKQCGSGSARRHRPAVTSMRA